MSESETNADDKYRFDFPLMPETVVEAAESLAESDDAYDQYLASELKRGYEKCGADLDGYRDISLESEDESDTEDTEQCPYCGYLGNEVGYVGDYDVLCENCRVLFDVRTKEKLEPYVPDTDPSEVSQ
jgi:hypothetical protein